MKLSSSLFAHVLVLGSALALVGCSTLPLSDPEPSPPDIPATDPGNTLAVSPDAVACDIKPALDWMESQTILYTQSPSDEWRDCSGNFLRLSSRIATLCPAVHLAAPAGITRFREGGNNKRPGVEEARSTRGLARWYDDKGMFTPIFYDGTDPLDAPASLQALRNSIKTGTVLWYSPRVPLAAAGKSGLYKEVGGAINHMGTVVDVSRDQAGNVIAWRMYHGQNPRKHNGVTRHVWARSGRSTPVPQGGYGRQRIVGFAESIIPQS